MRLWLPLAFFAVAALAGVKAASPQAAASFERPPVQAGANIDDCKAKLEAQGGGWCEIRQTDEDPSISSVWPKDLEKRTRMVVGPRAVLIAWNGAAFDEENRRLYFMGGGHRDYGGNEVYEFDLDSGKWTRLTDPSPLTYLAKYRDATAKRGPVYCWVPDMRQVPGAAHSYDGVQFSKKTRTIFLAMVGAANGACFVDNEGEFENDPRVLFGSRRGRAIFEFNPSRDETRNGIPPLTWRRVHVPKDMNITYPRTVEMPDGSLLMGDRRVLFRFEPTSGTVGKRFLNSPLLGDGLAEYHPSGTILSLHAGDLVRIPLGKAVDQRIPAPPIHGKSIAIDKNGMVFSWDGTDRVLTIDPESSDQAWRLYNWAGRGPSDGDGRVYSKWQYVASHDVFVGLSTHTTGVWVYKHPRDMPGMELTEEDPQSLINQATAGSTVTIPPGLYTRGLYVDKPLTLKLKGARFWGVAKRKGIINVRCNGCSVVIEDFHAEGRQAGCLGGNCAGIKAEGRNFDLTVRRAHIDNTVMGILTDNRGGRLVLEDSTIENIGLRDSSAEYAHGIYAGLIDTVVIRNSTIRNVDGDGHLVKSRAKHTTLEKVRLLAGEGRHSRSIDFPCGGTLQVSQSVIQHGENTDNPDVIAVGTEPRSCGKIRPAQVAITDSWLIIDRDRSADERARNYGPNFLFRWRAPLESLEVKRNHIVNLDEWSTTEVDRGDVRIPDLSEFNQICRKRADCGLSPGVLPDLW